MELKTFFKSTEAIIVLTGLALTVIHGKFWAFATAIAYIVVNVPNIYTTIKGWFTKK